MNIKIKVIKQHKEHTDYIFAKLRTCHLFQIIINFIHFFLVFMNSGSKQLSKRKKKKKLLLSHLFTILHISYESSDILVSSKSFFFPFFSFFFFLYSKLIITNYKYCSCYRVHETGQSVMYGQQYIIFSIIRPFSGRPSISGVVIQQSSSLTVHV